MKFLLPLLRNNLLQLSHANQLRYKEPHKNDHFVYAYSHDPNGIACIPDLLLENHLFYCVVVGGSSDRTCCSYGSDLRDP